MTENSICDNGSIMRLDGLIKSEQVLKCKSCSELIPNCMMCTSGSDCDLCKPGYRRAKVKDAYGVESVVCVTNFCGFYGEGSGCAGKVTIEGCD